MQVAQAPPASPSAPRYAVHHLATVPFARDEPAHALPVSRPEQRDLHLIAPRSLERFTQRPTLPATDSAHSRPLLQDPRSVSRRRVEEHDLGHACAGCPPRISRIRSPSGKIDPILIRVRSSADPPPPTGWWRLRDPLHHRRSGRASRALELVHRRISVTQPSHSCSRDAT